MAQPSRKADFFVDHKGICTPKAPPLVDFQKKRIFERDERQCKICKSRVRWGGNKDWYCEVQPGHVDHIFPRCLGGQNTPCNLVLLCRTCNLSKDQKSSAIVEIRCVGRFDLSKLAGENNAKN